MIFEYNATIISFGGFLIYGNGVLCFFTEKMQRMELTFFAKPYLALQGSIATLCFCRYERGVIPVYFLNTVEK
jgi:hypothetical protein